MFSIMEITHLASVIVFLQFLISFIHCEAESDVDSGIYLRHSRKKRYVVFPEGSVLSVAFCVSPVALTGARGIFTSGIAWAISYDLPNETIHEKNDVSKVSMTIHRHKRDLFLRIEKLIDTTGFGGRSCVLRTICETAAKLVPRQGILEEIFRVIFSYSPERKEESELENSGEIYVKAHKAGEIRENCAILFPCPISLLDLGLQIGEY